MNNEPGALATRRIEAELLPTLDAVIKDLNQKTPGANYSWTETGAREQGLALIEIRCTESWLLFAVGFMLGQAGAEYYRQHPKHE